MATFRKKWKSSQGRAMGVSWKVSTYLQSYVEQYGEAALIFASHDGYPQIVAGLLFTKECRSHELIHPSRNYNKQCTQFAFIFSGTQ
eukprot:5754097-Amphidinium_carterae.1